MKYTILFKAINWGNGIMLQIDETTIGGLPWLFRAGAPVLAKLRIRKILVTIRARCLQIWVCFSTAQLLAFIMLCYD